MTYSPLEIAVAVGVAIMTLRQLWSFITGSERETSKKLNTIERKIESLYEWHDVRGTNGKFVWYGDVDRLNTIIAGLNDVNENLSSIVNRLSVIADRLDRGVKHGSVEHG